MQQSIKIATLRGGALILSWLEYKRRKSCLCLSPNISIYIYIYIVHIVILKLDPDFRCSIFTDSEKPCLDIDCMTYTILQEGSDVSGCH